LGQVGRQPVGFEPLGQLAGDITFSNKT